MVSDNHAMQFNVTRLLTLAFAIKSCVRFAATRCLVVVAVNGSLGRGVQRHPLRRKMRHINPRGDKEV